jgi:hypothetical protein
MSVTKVTGMMQTSTKGGDIPSASPTVIDTDGDYFDVTGTTSFAAFTVVAGRRFTVQFDGALTMTHHATTLDLPGAANITTAAGDVAEFFATGTNTVQCVNYTKADGTAVVAGASGAWRLIGTSVASDSASLAQTGLDSTYDTYVIVYSDFKPASDAVDIRLRLGDSSGIDSGSTDYAYHNHASVETSSNYYGQSGDIGFLPIGLSIGNATAEGGGGIAYLHQPGDAVTFPIVTWSAGGVKEDTTIQMSKGVGFRQTVITVDRVELTMSSGNITSGRMSVYGIAHA